MITLNPKIQPKFNPNAERKIAGSREKLERALKGGESLKDIYNDGKDDLYKWKTVGNILTAGSATTAGGAVSNAYEVAKAGGKHYPWYKQQLDLGQRQLQKGIRSIEKQIEDHEGWLRDPQSKVNDWESRSPLYQNGLLKNWQQDISRQKEQVAILQGVLQEKGDER